MNNNGTDTGVVDGGKPRNYSLDGVQAMWMTQVPNTIYQHKVLTTFIRKAEYRRISLKN